MKPATVLVTASGTAASLSVLRTLRQQEQFTLRLIGIDTNPAELITGSLLCDRFYQVPRFDDPAYLPQLLQICRQEAIDVLIPVMDGEVEVIAQAYTALSHLGVSMLVPPAAIVEACSDKWLTYDLLCRNGAPTPATWLPEELERMGEPPAWPVIVKPRRGSGSYEVYRADNPAELAVFLRRVPDPIVQEYIDGDEYTVDVLADSTGRLLAVVPRLRIQTKAGVSTKGRTVYDEDLIERTTRLCQNIGLRGAANVQWRRNDLQLACIEINPRLSGGLALTIGAGANIPLMLLRLCLGEHVEPTDFRAGMTMIRSWAERFVLTEQLTPA